MKIHWSVITVWRVLTKEPVFMIIGPTIDWAWFNTVSNILEQGETKKKAEKH